MIPGGPEGTQAGVGVCLGNGDGTFQVGTFYPAGGENTTSIGGAVVGDFNGDGIPDIAVSGGSGVWLFTGKGDGTFNAGVLAVPLDAVLGWGIAAIDFNGDGNLDLVVTMPHSGHDGSGEGFVVIMGNGNGTFQTPQAFAAPSEPVGLAVGPLTKAALRALRCRLAPTPICILGTAPALSRDPIMSICPAYPAPAASPSAT